MCQMKHFFQSFSRYLHVLHFAKYFQASSWTSMFSVFTSSTSDSSSSSVSVSNLVKDDSVSGSKSPRFARMATDFSTRSFVSLLRTFVCVFPNSDQLRSAVADVGGIWRRMEATGARASDPQSPFHQVDGEMCWLDCQIPSPCQRPCLVRYFAKLSSTLLTSRPRWWNNVVITV